MLLDQESLRFIFGLKLRSLRLTKKFSLKELAEISGLSASYINEIEKGKKYPKSEKILQLAESLGVTYDDLISLRLKNELGLLSKFLERNLLKGLPLEVFGIPARTVFELMADDPQKFGALLGTLLEITRQHDIHVEDFFHATLRAYIDMNGNYFPEIETKVEEFKKEFQWNKFFQTAPTSQGMKTFLLQSFQKKVIELNFNKESSELKHLFFFHGEGSKGALYLNENLSEREKIFILAKETGYCHYRLKERLNGFSKDIDSYSVLYNNFLASYFASALLIPKDGFIEEIAKFLKKDEWKESDFLTWAQSYPATQESFFHRLAQILPTFFQVERLFFIRYNYSISKKMFELNRELHLSELHVPHRLKHNEHYCRRWISTTLLQEIEKTPQKEKAGAQRSHFFLQDQEYLCLAIAHPHELNSDETTCCTIGLLVNEATKGKIALLDDTRIPRKKVAHTCEQCNLSDCQERAAPPIQEDKRIRQEFVRSAISKVIQEHK